ncbi:MAG: CoA-binding protein [Candidatus Sungbacteria bacterium]|nr:CoA-binding protein [bacterium]MDZ4285446.1 CoA-binding protein [Candidatus Sungbacteria bacterium]
MAILLSHTTRVLIQGITGKEGQRALVAMKNYHTKVLCGVTPGKGGQEVEGVGVYNSVAEAKERFPDINASVVCVPPIAARDAIMESIESGMSLVNVMTERIPMRDASFFLSAARERGVRIVGPASIGIIAPGVGRLGLIGGSAPDEIYTKGQVGIISRSGGMANELAWMFHQHGMGMSTVLGIGGDFMIGSTYHDLLTDFERDHDTHAVAVFGEMGGEYEYEIAELAMHGMLTKPVVVYIGGKFGSTLPEGMPLGHAGALIDRGRGSVEAKEQMLIQAGIVVAHDLNELPLLVKKQIEA